MTRPRHIWSDDDDATLRQLYPTHSAAEIAAVIGASVKAVWSRAAGLGIKKPAAWIAENARRNSLKEGHGGRAFQFRKGQTPWNAGREFDSGGRSHDTRFKPGHRGGNALDLWQPVGTTRINKDGYTERKINDDFPMHRRWRAEHLVIWEAANGSLPKATPSPSRTATKPTWRSTTWNSSPAPTCCAATVRNAGARKSSA